MSPVLAALVERQNALETRILALPLGNKQRRRLVNQQAGLWPDIDRLARAENICVSCLSAPSVKDTFGQCRSCYDEVPF